MIILASGQIGLNRWVEETYGDRLAITAVDRWDTLEPMISGARQVLVGEALSGLPVDSDAWWVLCRQYPHIEWVFWVSAARVVSSPPHGVSIWRGEIDQTRLRQWISPDPPAVASHETMIPRRWGMLSLYPYPDRRPLWDWWIRKVTATGKDGGWIDLDWDSAGFTLAQTRIGPSTSRSEWALLRKVEGTGYWIVPAPPPWLPLPESATGSKIEWLVRQIDSWQAWDFGRRLSNMAWAALPYLDMLILWVDRDTPPTVFQSTVESIRPLLPSLTIECWSLAGVHPTVKRVVDRLHVAERHLTPTTQSTAAASRWTDRLRGFGRH
ncbi:hypothetical protein TPY_0999 [Sulfobacillus acidophilus TPY]|uniref:Uncharacterized protein n=1 Tax=Sulfobacillus acidophilus (strain ATCC 700253 / DSM 10332 / NAL) TaxID=679936 RepID=G8TXA7_SULAD|nr:hypothetical protein TPY_0999 [Sulfobacillus acidophilus TPY]AEW06109.1 hypothetical protein Sulac_2647 [Sulfobacillus acidophilus DSM 10332]